MLLRKGSAIFNPLGRMSQSCCTGRNMTNSFFARSTHQTSAEWLRNVHSAALMHRLLSTLLQARPTTVSMRSTTSQTESCETSRMATCTAAPRKQPRQELMDLLGSFPKENSWNNFATKGNRAEPPTKNNIMNIALVEPAVTEALLHFDHHVTAQPTL